MFSNDQYHRYRKILKGERLPLAFVDLDAFDSNIRLVCQTVRDSGRKIRLGTKSVRCEPLLRRIFDLGGPVFHGLLTYAMEETAWLAGKGYDNLIVAYPSVQTSDLNLLADLRRQGKLVYLMVDCCEHLRLLSEAGKRSGVELWACLEIDLAYRPMGSDSLHLGLRRSPIRTPEQVEKLLLEAGNLPNVAIRAVMAYEGHIAGTMDAVPGKAVKNHLTRWIKHRSIKEFTPRRGKVIEYLARKGIRIDLVNGGGSGSLLSTLEDPCITEVTVGSGFFCPTLFHHFAEIAYTPAAFFALQIVRLPSKRMVTCQGGGYPASGPCGADRLPLPVLPPGLTYLPLEAAGEVQTPLLLPTNGPHLNLGDAVIFQHAKAGELCERFNELVLLKQDGIMDRVPTYRGEGKAFL